MLRKYRAIVSGVVSSSSSSSLIDDVGEDTSGTDSITPFPNNKRSPLKPSPVPSPTDRSAFQRAKRDLRKNNEFLEMISSSAPKHKSRADANALYSFDEAFDEIYADSDEMIDSDDDHKKKR